MSDVKPVRLQLSRRKGFDLQKLSLETNGLPAVNVARPSKWGNPWKPGMMYRGFTHVSDLRHAFVLYRAEAPLNKKLIEAARNELRGKNLACWCALTPYAADRCCHADVLLELVSKVWFRVGEDHSYYGGPDYKCVTAEQCSELEKRFADAERDIADNPPKVTG